MPTFADMVEETLGHLRAYSTDQDAKTSLADGLTKPETTFSVTNPDQLSAGLVEIGEELVEVSQVDDLSGSVTVHPWGRGQMGSTVADHAAGERVAVSPRWPRVWVKRALNEVIGSLYPDLFAVRTDESQSVVTTRIAYPLPADVLRVLDIRYLSPITSTGEWLPVNGWRLDLQAGAAVASNASVDITEGMWPGAPMKIVYAAEPSPLSAGSDDFTATGLPASCSDLVCLGAAARLVTSADLARTQVFTVEHTRRLSDQPAGSATAASRYLQQLYQIRLMSERDKLLGRYPIRLRRTW